MDTAVADNVKNEIDLKVEMAPVDAVYIADNITDDISAQTASGWLRELSRLYKQVEDYWKSDIEKANSLHKSLTAKRKVQLDQIEAAKKTVTRELEKYLNEKAQRERIEHERRSGEAIKQAEMAKAAAAEAAAKAGNTQKAEAILAQPTMIAATASAPTKIEGIKMTPSWEIVNMDEDGKVSEAEKMQFIKAVAAGIAPLSAIELNMWILRRLARDMKSENPWPGIVCQLRNKASSTGR